MKKNEKTNAMRLLDGKKIKYETHTYKADASLRGEEVAELLGESPEMVFKTLVTRGRSGQYYVFVIPVTKELDLKKAAKAAGEKSVSMIKQKELLPLTGYIHGGCSPIGMKKRFPAFVHETAEGLEKIYVSGGRVGMQIGLATHDLAEASGCVFADIV